MPFFPTNHYPGIYWPTSRQVEAALPVTAAPPVFGTVVSEAMGASGVRVAQFVRIEEQRQLSFFGLDALETAQWGQYFTERGGRGQQAELLVDRFTGRAFTFQNTAADQNFEPVTSIASPQYETTSGQKIGLVQSFAAGAAAPVLRFIPNVGSMNAAVVGSEGTIVLTMICSFHRNSSSGHTLWAWGTTGANTHQIAVELNPQRDLAVSFGNPFGTRTRAGWAGPSTGVMWNSGERITFIAQWTTGSSLGFWVITQSATVQAPTESLSGYTFTMPDSIVTIGAALAGASTAPGIILHFATYKKAYLDPTVLSSHFPFGRNYYSRAEVAERTFQPQRVHPGTDLWLWTWSFRQGT